MGFGDVSTESNLSPRKSYLNPFLPRGAWAHLLKGREPHADGASVRASQAPDVMSVEPLYAFCILDPFMRFTQVSPVIAELTGYSVEELSCMGLQEIVVLDSMEATITAFEKIDGLGWSHHTVRFYRKDGIEAEARIDAIQLLDNQYLAWVREVRTRAGKALKAG